MALEPSHLPLVLLALLASGFWAQRLEAEILRHGTVGQTFSETCKYSAKARNSYTAKSWYRKIADKRIHLVSTSKPRTWAWDARYSLWDEPSSGIIEVRMVGLKEEDSGHYLCAARRSSTGGIIPLKRIHLVVTPETSAPASVRVSEPRLLTPTSSKPAAPGALVPVVCGILVAKGLALSALVTFSCYRCLGHKNALGTVAEETPDGPRSAQAPE